MTLLGRGVLTTPPLGPFYGSVGTQSTAQCWHIEPLAPMAFLKNEIATQLIARNPFHRKEQKDKRREDKNGHAPTLTAPFPHPSPFTSRLSAHAHV